MYGLVNKAVENLITNKFNADIWLEIKNKAGVNTDNFICMQNYDDKITYDLVAAASDVLNIPQEDILFAFGKYWVEYTAQEGYGNLLEMAGNSLPEFLKNLNALHVRVAMTHPDLRPPSFICDEIDGNTLLVKYFSHRDGLAPLVIGLLHGLADKFKLNIHIDHTPQQEQKFHAFKITYTPLLSTPTCNTFSNENLAN